MSADPWNVNIHYDARLDACVPPSATSVLDVGCGDGFLAARLARRVPRVVAIDVDAPVLERARARFPEAKVTWRNGDVMTYPFARASFDAVVSNATLHHFPNSKGVHEVLPGARVSRQILGRHLIAWQAPA
ncbi:class I SAM-dependent methyltransferase [Actinopolymorpha sp. B11F2]|uniref:class I SAM-dependent methyltransferase n=1 Tax=Actinopolymorpha sp. B11F2 TaxID=3160862 RepID=UPI0032E4C687